MPPQEAAVSILSVEKNSAEYRGKNSAEYRGRAGGEAVKIHLSDGSFFVLHAEAWARSALSPGSPLDPRTLSILLARSERVFARHRALALLSRSAQTSRGLARKLAARGFSAAAVRHAISRMTALGYLDDRAFAEAWVLSRLDTRSEGWKSLYRGLVGRGIARPLADEVAGELYPPELEAERARLQAGELSAPEAVRRLSMRGFRSRAIALVLREIRGKGRQLRAE